MGLILAMVGCSSEDGPVDYALPAVMSPTVLESLVGVTGADGASAANSAATVPFEDGRWLHVELLYVDEPLSEHVTPPDGVELAAGDALQVPVEGEAATFTFAARPDELLDEVVRCVRVVVHGDGFDPVTPEASAAFVDVVEATLDDWRWGLATDPCEGRPDAPPAGSVADRPAGVLG